MTLADEFIKRYGDRVNTLNDRLTILLSTSRNQFGHLTEANVPERGGVYFIYEDCSVDPIYVGIAKQAGSKVSGEPSGLRFRIMRNHLGKRGTDNFLKYLTNEFQGDKQLAIDYVRNHCSCSWLVLEDEKEIQFLEHYSIAVLNPRLNRA
ncbi:hypothetical protein btf_275 [Dehalococcoides mccartyi BTF08]|nr:hypothetical protein btf_275 [Dehalococcoides mccartyi BTF08]AQW61788.1 hypothetical protein B1779_00410 [Dehalococcoides mccartyi]